MKTAIILIAILAIGTQASVQDVIVESINYLVQ